MKNNYTKYYNTIIYYMLILSILFRGPTLFRLIPSAIGAIRYNYLIVIVLLILFISNINRKHLLFFCFIFLIIFINITITQKYYFEYIIYIFQFFSYYIIWTKALKRLSIPFIFEKLNTFLIILEVLALYEIISGQLLFHLNPPYDLNTILKYNRSYLFFYNSNNVSLFILSLFIILLSYNISKTEKREIIIIQVLLQFFIYIINDSKLVLVMLLITIMLVVLSQRKRKMHFSKYFNIFIFILLIIFFVIGKLIIDNKEILIIFKKYALYNILNDSRFEIYKEALSVFLKNPIGIGLGYSDYYFFTNVHSIIIQIITEFGILGLLFWGIYYLYFTLRMINNKLKKNDYIKKGFIIYQLLIFPILSSQVSRILSDNAIISTWALALAINWYQEEKKQKFNST